MVFYLSIPSLVFLVFNILGIILGDVTSHYTKSLVVIFCIYIVIVLFDDGKRIFLYFIAVLFGIYGSFLTIYIKNDNKFVEFNGNKVKIVADVLSQSKKKADIYYYNIQTKSVKFRGETKFISEKLLLKTTNELQDAVHREISFVGEIKIPKESRNFGGFNYKRYLNSKAIKGTIFSNNIHIGNKIKKSMLSNWGGNIRQKILKTIDNLLNKKEARLLKCILIGDNFNLEDDFGFRDLGLAHVLSVSGINILYMSMIVRFLLKKLKVTRKLINSILIIMLGFYSLVVGFTPSLIRSVIMRVLALMGEFLFYKSRPISNLALAAIIILLINPFLMYSIGFQFSFIATLFIILFADKIIKVLEKKKFFNKESLGISIVVYFGILPLEMYHFNKISFCSIIVNIIVAPIHSIIIFMGIIMTAIGSISNILAKPIAIFVEIIIKFLFMVSDAIAKLSISKINIVYIGVVGVLLCYSILGFIYFYNNSNTMKVFVLKYRNVSIILATICTFISFLFPKNLKVNFMDVGQGDCVIIQTIHNKNILIDGGENIDVSDIIRNNVKKIDIMIATHGHMDHIGGLLNVLNNMKVDKLIVPDTKNIGDLDKLKIDTNKTKLYRCKVNDDIYIDQYTKIEFLNPYEASNFDGENDNSLVLKLMHKGINFLFTADITESCEKYILDRNVDLNSHILKIAHHGSMYSTSDEFLNKVNPNLAIISVGENNKFGHPSHKVLEKLYKKNVKVLRTDKNGQVQIITDGKNIKVRSKFF